MKFKSRLHTFIPMMLLALTACGETPAAGRVQTTASSASSVEAQSSAPVKVANDVPPEVARAIVNTLEKNYADQKLRVQNIATSPIAGLYEVIFEGKQIAYTDRTGDYMVVGDLIKTDEGRSLTEERKESLNAVNFDALPLDKAIKEVRGNGALKVVVFSDPDCPFCRHLEHEFAKMTNITIYNFMMPISQLHPDGMRKAVQVMCQPNPTKAWTEWMREGKMPPKVAECKNSVAQTTQLGDRLGFHGTPAMVFPNGKVQNGYIPMPQLEAVIKANQK